MLVSLRAYLVVVTLAAIVVSGCTATQGQNGLDGNEAPRVSNVSDKKLIPSSIFKSSKDLEKYGILISSPMDKWDVRRNSYPFSFREEGNQEIFCPFGVRSPWPSRRSSRTFVDFCTSTGKRPNLKFFAENIRTVARSYPNVTHWERGEDLESISYIDVRVRKWNGVRFVDTLYGINSISGNPYIEKKWNVFLISHVDPSWIVWVVFTEVVNNDIATFPYSHGLSVLDYIFFSGEK